MISRESENKGYRAYLVRLWQIDRNGQPVWRASVEDAHTGERRAFSDIFHLLTFLEETASCSQLTPQNKEQTNND